MNMVRAFQQMLGSVTLFLAFAMALLLSFICAKKPKRTIHTLRKPHPQQTFSLPSAKKDKKEKARKRKKKSKTPEFKLDTAQQTLQRTTEPPQSTPSGNGKHDLISDTMEDVVIGGKKRKRNSYVNLDLKLSENDEDKSHVQMQAKDKKAAATAGASK